MSLRRALAALIRPLPQWSAIALHDPQDEIAVMLEAGGASVDVTRNHAIAALAPMTVAVGLDIGTEACAMSFIDRARGRALGTLRLKPAAREPGLTLFEVTGGDHSCLGQVRARLDAWHRRRAPAKSTDPYNFAMAPEATAWIAITYICPRPVFLVSTGHEGRLNIFPMDLVGPLGSDERFSLALRNTSPSVKTIETSRRIVLSSAAASAKDVAYKLGAHHRKESIDPNDLPFALTTSARFGMRHPADAIRVRELEIADCKDIGSHTVFIGSVVSDERMSDEPQLFHTAGFHQRYRTRHGRPFLLA